MEQPTRTPSPFASWLREQIGDRSLRQIAEYSGVDKSMLSLYVRGRAVPNARTIRRLAAYFRVDPRTIAALLPDPLSDEPADRSTAGPDPALRELVQMTVRETLAQLAPAPLAPDDPRLVDLALEINAVLEQMTEPEIAAFLRDFRQDLQRYRRARHAGS